MEQAPDLAHELLETLRGISRRLEEQSKRLSKEHGLTLPQLMCLEAIGAAEEPPTLATLADLVKLSSATVSRIVERLVRAGLVDRSRGIVDRRHVRLTLTSAGQERYEAHPAPLQAEFLQRLRALPAVERDQLVASLRQIADLMGPEAG